MANLIIDVESRKRWFDDHTPLSECSWSKAHLQYLWPKIYNDVDKWITDSCSGTVVRWVDTYYFEQESDKLLFVLRWANLCQ